MTKLPLLSSKELCKFLEKEGFQLIRQKGSLDFIGTQMIEQQLYLYIQIKILREAFLELFLTR